MLVAPFETLDAGDFESALRDNFLSAVYTTLAVAPSMRRRRRGRIVNITSIGGKVQRPPSLPYSASKFAMVGFSEGLRPGARRHRNQSDDRVPRPDADGQPAACAIQGRVRSEFDWFISSASAPGLSMSADRAGARSSRPQARRIGSRSLIARESRHISARHCPGIHFGLSRPRWPTASQGDRRDDSTDLGQTTRRHGRPMAIDPHAPRRAPQ